MVKVNGPNSVPLPLSPRIILTRFNIPGVMVMNPVESVKDPLVEPNLPVPIVRAVNATLGPGLPVI